jgi:serine/threonine-protein kinase
MTGALPYHVEANNLATAIDTISNHVPKLASKNIQQSSVIAKTEKKLNRKLTGEIEQIIAKAIAKEPQRRYLSAAQLSQDIDNCWHNRPVMAKKDSLFYRSKKFVQRHVFGVSLGAIAVIALLVLTTTLFLQSKDLQQSLKRISNEQQRVVQVTDFLKNMFKISDPLVTDAKIIQVKDLLDYSRQKLDAEFSDEPITKATLYETLGNVYLNLSHLKQAESLFDKAYALFESEHDDTGLLRIYLAKTRLLQQQGKLKAAQAQTDALLKRFKFEQLDKPIQAEIEVFQAQNYYQLGKFKQAKRQLLSALDKRLEIYGEENTLVVDIYQLLGNVYWRLGDFKQVQKYYQKSYDLNKSLLGESHHKTIKSRSALGVLAYSQGKYSKALEDFNYVAKARLNRLGDKHILTASAFNRLGATYFEAGLYDQAEKHLNTALTIFDNLGLSQSMKYARTLNNLGLVERQNKQYSKAQQTFIKAKAIEIKNLGETHVDVAGINNNVGMVAADLGNFQQALALFKQAYHVLYEKQGMKNANIAFSMTNIGRMYLQMGDTQQAQDWINRALKLRQEKLGKDHLYTIETLSAAAEIDMENGSLVQAKEKLQHIIKLRKNQLPKNDWRIAESQALLALLNSQHDSSQTHWYYCQLQIVSEKLGNNHYRTLRLKHKQATFKLPAMVNIPECNGL